MGFPTRPSNVRVCQFHHSGAGRWVPKKAILGARVGSVNERRPIDHSSGPRAGDRARVFAKSSAKVLQDLTRRIGARPAGHAAAGVRPRAAEVEAVDRASIPCAPE